MNSRENGAGFHKCGIKIAGTPKGSSAQTRDANAGAHLYLIPLPRDFARQRHRMRRFYFVVRLSQLMQINAAR
jgi:hypothetical protein